MRRVLETGLSNITPQPEIQHVGSTSVTGLVAKPVLDIDIIIADKTTLHQVSAGLEKLGYKSKGEQGIPGRFAFRQTSETTPSTNSNRTWQQHHLYVCYADSLALKNHLLFRDILRTNEQLREEYSELKKSLADDLSFSREEYTKRKTEFIISVLSAAGLTENELQEISRANT
ncbi:MAG: GrpB family protein [Bacteroidota bacterium]